VVRATRIRNCPPHAAIALFSSPTRAQEKRVPYGANDSAEHFLQITDARIYSETYGAGGTPLVLLHGGLYGYIDDAVESFLDKAALSQR
jgi:hypothetical protein